MDRFDASYQLVHYALEHGGCTLDSEGVPLSLLDRRWVVAVRPSVSVSVKASAASRTNVALWLDVVEGTVAPDEGVGSWLAPSAEGMLVHDGPTVIVLDVVRLVRTRAEALRLAAAAGQRAIYQPATGETVYLKEAA